METTGGGAVAPPREVGGSGLRSNLIGFLSGGGGGRGGAWGHGQSCKLEIGIGNPRNAHSAEGRRLLSISFACNE